MSEEKKKLEVVFAPGCFDGFEGTQEELDELIAEIHAMIESGEFLENSRPVDVENLTEEELEKLDMAMDSIEDQAPRRLLN